MSKISFTQAFRINVRLWLEAFWLVSKIVVVGIGLLVLGLGAVDSLIWKYLYGSSLFDNFNIWIYPSNYVKTICFMGYMLILYYFYKKPFNRSLKRKYKNFQLDFVENQPGLKFYLTNCLLGYIAYELTFMTVSRLIFNYPLSQSLLSLIDLEEYFCWNGWLISLPVTFLASIFILQWQLNRDTDKFKIITI